MGTRMERMVLSETTGIPRSTRGRKTYSITAEPANDVLGAKASAHMRYEAG